MRGAMLTETFYYSDPNNLQGKMRKVLVFFDTTFLLRAIGLCDNKYSVSCLELIEILRSMGVRMWCFKQTFNEIHGILRAASTQTRRRGRTLPHRPGDVFDYYNSIGASESDIELDIATLENKLNKIAVQVKEKPKYEKALTVDENVLREEIITELPSQSEQAQSHDIDCLTSIYRLRRGRVEKCLESCGAIFITSNIGLAKASTRFFNKYHGISDAPVCMPDQVFTTLVWLKAVNKAPDLPRHRLVANCFAALQPSDELWRSYVKEANSLRDKGTIGEEDYAVLIYSLEARDKLMELTLGEDENIRGTVQDVLAAAKKNYTAELSRNLKETQLKLAAQQNRIMALISKIAKISKNVVLWFLIIVWFILLFYIIAWTSPDEINKANLLSFNAWAFWLSVFVTLMNLIFGCKVYSLCKIISDKISKVLVNRLRGLLVCKPSQEF